MAKAYGKWTTVEVLRNLLHLDFDTLDNLDKLDIGNIPYESSFDIVAYKLALMNSCSVLQ